MESSRFINHLKIALDSVAEIGADCGPRETEGQSWELSPCLYGLISASKCAKIIQQSEARKRSTVSWGRSNPNSLSAVTIFAAFCGLLAIQMSISAGAAGQARQG